ncbi:MAG: DUF2169 domain-containing protein [Planctomycetaceae bacterium]|nr:DUF2169 domain-containing protein [Planctomycetaceae bacterium]
MNAVQIQLHNPTPFVPLQFESVDAKLNHFGVVVLRGTFDIVNGQLLQLSRQQTTMVLEDQYYGDPLCSSLRQDSCMAPYKPATDLLIEATAYSPSGRPEDGWKCEVRAGELHKAFRVTGKRTWRKGPLGYRLSSIEPVSTVPIRYELAYGGTSFTKPDDRWADNPVGTGFDGSGDAEVVCPQVLPVNVDSPRYGERIASEGLTPIAPSWQSRLRHAGTFDPSWVAERAPYLPADFSYEFYNVASPGLTFPGFAAGDEVFQLTNLSDDHNLTFQLPGIELIAIMSFTDGRIVPGPMNLDTIELLIEERQAVLHWRGIYPAHLPISDIELQMDAPAYLIEN